MLKFRSPDGRISEMSPEDAEKFPRICSHEIGHMEVAGHFGSSLVGVGWEDTPVGFQPVSFYEIPPEASLKDNCTIIAAGAAGEVVGCGTYSGVGPRIDRKQYIETGFLGDFDVRVEAAAAILRSKIKRFERLVKLLQGRLNSDDVATMGRLRNGRLGVLLLNDTHFEPHEDD